MTTVEEKFSDYLLNEKKTQDMRNFINKMVQKEEFNQRRPEKISKQLFAELYIGFITGSSFLVNKFIEFSGLQNVQLPGKMDLFFKIAGTQAYKLENITVPITPSMKNLLEKKLSMKIPLNANSSTGNTSVSLHKLILLNSEENIVRLYCSITRDHYESLSQNREFVDNIMYMFSNALNICSMLVYLQFIVQGGWTYSIVENLLSLILVKSRRYYLVNYASKFGLNQENLEIYSKKMNGFVVHILFTFMNFEKTRVIQDIKGDIEINKNKDEKPSMLSEAAKNLNDIEQTIKGIENFSEENVSESFTNTLESKEGLTDLLVQLYEENIEPQKKNSSQMSAAQKNNSTLYTVLDTVSGMQNSPVIYNITPGKNSNNLSLERKVVDPVAQESITNYISESITHFCGFVSNRLFRPLFQQTKKRGYNHSNKNQAAGNYKKRKTYTVKRK
jgi:hypothetical protein